MRAEGNQRPKTEEAEPNLLSRFQTKPDKIKGNNIPQVRSASADQTWDFPKHPSTKTGDSNSQETKHQMVTSWRFVVGFMTLNHHEPQPTNTFARAHEVLLGAKGTEKKLPLIGCRLASLLNLQNAPMFEAIRSCHQI